MRPPEISIERYFPTRSKCIQMQAPGVSIYTSFDFNLSLDCTISTTTKVQNTKAREGKKKGENTEARDTGQAKCMT